ncbi:hypothetical protein N7535_008397 [Penicillium sp. DV-2018c]|nr:hypothetical protein N7535_008397 [Penicillium sp. DV-2018c]
MVSNSGLGLWLSSQYSRSRFSHNRMEPPIPVNRMERLARGEEAIEKAEAGDKGTDPPGAKA